MTRAELDELLSRYGALVERAKAVLRGCELVSRYDDFSVVGFDVGDSRVLLRLFHDKGDGLFEDDEEVPLDLLLMEADEFAAWSSAREAERAARVAARAAQASVQQEERERAEYARLRAKFGG